MKAILEFNLPEDQEQFTDAVNGTKWQQVMWQLDTHLRSKSKYADDDTHEEYIKAVDEVRNHLWELMTENGLNFN